MANVERMSGKGFMRREWRELGRLLVDSLVAGAFVSMVLALAVFIVSTQTAAAAPVDDNGGLRLKDGHGGHVNAPLLFTDVHMDITGMTARVQVRQRFANPTAEWREGVYVFPLPEKAAVDHLNMQIGDRVIEGLIKERNEARRTYEAAKDEGRKTTLIEQERPNMFTTSVANIGPNEEIVVAIEYQETLRYDEGSFSLRFPLAITPRYIPGLPVAGAVPGMGWSAATQQVLDADRITPPVANRGEGYVNPVTLTIDLDAGFGLTRLSSVYHPMKIEEKPGHRYHLTLAEGPVPAARDFELSWTPDVGSAPGAALFTETKGGRTYALLMALPPSAPIVEGPRSPREITYIIDTSGSMEGVSMTQAREGLSMALDRLQPGDRFNVIEFNSISTSLFTAPMPVDATTLQKARQFVNRLAARGGTEMLPALKLALDVDTPATMLRQVVFLTDGSVGNEDEILKLIHDRIGDRRLFTIGIGPAPNTFFMTRAAQFGHGTFTYIGDVREVKAKMTALFRKLEQPALTDITVDWPAGADVWPRVMPDLYAGEPVVVTAQYNVNAVTGNVALAGRRGNTMWGTLLPVTAQAPHAGVGVLWARAKISALMDTGRNGVPEEEVRAAVLDVALTHHLVSKYTSLVAVDVTPTKPAGVNGVTSAIPGNVPEGLTGFDQLPRTATSMGLQLLMGALLLMAAALLVRQARVRSWMAAAVAVTCVMMALPDDASAQASISGDRGNAMILMPGNYNDVGSWDFDLATVPVDGWVVLEKGTREATITRARVDATGRPLFLPMVTDGEAPAEVDTAFQGERYFLRVPGTSLHAGTIDEVPLQRRGLTPILDHRYELQQGARPFALMVRNGLRSRDGKPYGEGAHYAIEIEGNRFEYFLPGFGWESHIEMAGDFDDDGRPDFIVHVSGSNSWAVYLLLSSRAQPGMNAPVAFLHGTGC